MGESNRTGLQNELESVMNGRGKVYFLPGENISLEYPCIVYELSTEEFFQSNNRTYAVFDYYDVTIIDPDPTSKIKDDLIKHGFSSIRFDRRYKSDNLYHTVYKICYRRSDANEQNQVG